MVASSDLASCANRERMAAIAAASGAATTIESRPQYREHYVTADFADVSVSFEIGDTLAPGIMAHWHGAKRDLASFGAFDSINIHHKRKATTYRNSPDAFADAFRHACEAVADGSAFA